MSQPAPPGRLVIDTDVVIELLRKRERETALFLALADAGVTILLSHIVIAETYAGAWPKEHREIEGLFSLCRTVVTDAQTGRVAGQYAQRYRKSHHGISLEDYLLAATARVHGCPLWTGNRKHYPMDDIVFYPTPVPGADRR